MTIPARVMTVIVPGDWKLAQQPLIGAATMVSVGTRLHGSMAADVCSVFYVAVYTVSACSRPAGVGRGRVPPAPATDAQFATHPVPYAVTV